MGLAITKNLYQGYAVLPGQRRVMHLATGTPSQIAGRVRTMDKLVKALLSDARLWLYLPPHDQECLEFGGVGQTSEPGWVAEVVIVPYPCEPPTFDELQAGLPGQASLEWGYQWLVYGSEPTTLLDRA